MKQTIYITVVGVILAVLLSVGITSFLSKPTSVDSGLGAIQPVGQTETNLKWFAGGLFGGNAQQWGVDVNGVETLNTLSDYVSAGSLGGNASTTILSIKNPFNTTSTVNFVALYETKAATTTFSIACATSTTAYAPTSLSGSIISSGNIATSTNFGLIENGITTALGASITGGTAAKILVNAGSYLICQVTETYSSGYWTNSTNAFAGTYKVRWAR